MCSYHKDTKYLAYMYILTPAITMTDITNQSWNSWLNLEATLEPSSTQSAGSCFQSIGLIMDSMFIYLLKLKFIGQLVYKKTQAPMTESWSESCLTIP